MSTRALIGSGVMMRCRVVWGHFLNELGNFFGRAAREQRGGRFVAELAQGLHRQPAVPLDEHGKSRNAVAIGKLAEDLCEIGWMLFLKDIAEIRRGAYA